MRVSVPHNNWAKNQQNSIYDNRRELTLFLIYHHLPSHIGMFNFKEIYSTNFILFMF